MVVALNTESGVPAPSGWPDTAPGRLDDEIRLGLSDGYSFGVPSSTATADSSQGCTSRADIVFSSNSIKVEGLKCTTSSEATFRTGARHGPDRLMLLSTSAGRVCPESNHARGESPHVRRSGDYRRTKPVGTISRRKQRITRCRRDDRGETHTTRHER